MRAQELQQINRAYAERTEATRLQKDLNEREEQCGAYQHQLELVNNELQVRIYKLPIELLPNPPGSPCLATDSKELAMGAPIFGSSNSSQNYVASSSHYLQWLQFVHLTIITAALLAIACLICSFIWA